MCKLILILIVISSVSYAKSGPYVSADVGIGIPQQTRNFFTIVDRYSMNHIEHRSTYQHGLHTGIAFGYNFGNSFALEFNAEYNTNKMKNSRLFILDEYNFQTKAFTQYDDVYNEKFRAYKNDTIISLVNGYYFIPFVKGLKPYIGTGLGYICSMFYDNEASYAKSKSGIAIQYLVGIKYGISNRFDIFTDFRHLYGDLHNYKYQLSTVRIGASFKI